MNKLALAALALCGMPAFAQTSNITIYGVIDLGVRHASGITATHAPSNGSVSAMTSGADNTSRWGIRGTEDLGSGNSVSFALESGLAADTGSQLNSSKYFDRASWVGLSGAWGRLTAGRQTVLLADSVIATETLGLRFAGLNPNIAITALSAPGLGIEYGSAGSTAGSYRLDNALKYVKSFGPVTASAMYGFGESSSSFGASSSKGASLLYAQSGLTVSGAFQTFRAADNRKLDGYTLGANYRTGSMKWAATAGRNQAETSSIAKTTLSVYSVGGTWTATGNIDLTGAYYHVERKRTVNGKDGYGRFIALTEYRLSRRSKLFAELDYTRWRDGFQGVANDSSAKGFTLGLSHSF